MTAAYSRSCSSVIALEALAALERRAVLVTVECQGRLAPQAAQEARVDSFLGEPVLVVEDLRLVEVALDQDADPLTA